jgi:phosphoribosylglycinamide formyltransferase 1
LFETHKQDDENDPETSGTHLTRLVVMASGNGSNLQAIMDACSSGNLNANIVCVISDQPAATALKRAAAAGIPTCTFPWRPYREMGRDRRAYDADLAELVRTYSPDWIVLAGWMRLLSSAFLERFPMQVINLHPALPGTFPGTHAIERAWDDYKAGLIQHTGVMVHFVPDEGVDTGPVIVYEVVPFELDDNLNSLTTRIHAVEHRLLITALRSLIAPLISAPQPE